MNWKAISDLHCWYIPASDWPWTRVAREAPRSESLRKVFTAIEVYNDLLQASLPVYIVALNESDLKSLSIQMPQVIRADTKLFNTSDHQLQWLNILSAYCPFWTFPEMEPAKLSCELYFSWHYRHNYQSVAVFIVAINNTDIWEACYLFLMINYTDVARLKQRWVVGWNRHLIPKSSTWNFHIKNFSRPEYYRPLPKTLSMSYDTHDQNICTP